MNLRTKEKYTVKNARLVINNDDSIIIELNRGQKWELVGLYSFSRCAIQRENVTIEIPVSDFKDIFGEERVNDRKRVRIDSIQTYQNKGKAL